MSDKKESVVGTITRERSNRSLYVARRRKSSKGFPCGATRNLKEKIIGAQILSIQGIFQNLATCIAPSVIMILNAQINLEDVARNNKS